MFGLEKCEETEQPCQNGGTCNEDEDSPFCECKPGTSGDLCSVVDECEEDSEFCGSGDDVTCKYDSTEEKAYCHCTVDLKQFDTNAKVCKQKCGETDHLCQNGGTCNVDEDSPFCECKPGTSGDLCSVVDECEEDSKFCGSGDDVTCKYDSTKEKAYCHCTVDSKQFDTNAKVCKQKCGETDHLCQNGGTCNVDEDSPFCECKPGTSGDLCSVVDECEEDSEFCGSGDDVTCKYDSTKEKAYCHCTVDSKQFDTNAKVCKQKCEETEQPCQNGGKCNEDEDSPFCECKPGTSGDLCSVVDECEEDSEFCGSGDDVTCKYDSTKEKAYCHCTVDSKQFDTNAKVCKRKF
ncbi:protein crumbs-like [Uloborus diversus]|uniref:protein crumbs-like n=1 Tax=Uloborus diversus TaxID=327109 RepID=UPI0024094A6F|nr:protein crumbs-like [Uloborus diversus]